MNDVYVEETEESYSPFWPLVILVAGLLLWSGYQAAVAYAQKAAFTSELQTAMPTINAAQGAESKLFAVFQDLQQTAQKDANAAQIVKESHIQLRPNGTASPGTNADTPSH